MFLWHTAPDKSVDINNSFRYAARLHELDISMEMHIYPVGGHGLGLANSVEGRIVPYVQSWSEHLIKWLEFNEYIGVEK
jgi:dipeptidyl aminopeptidase/acylaminoacyl peptidase